MLRHFHFAIVAMFCHAFITDIFFFELPFMLAIYFAFFMLRYAPLLISSLCCFFADGFSRQRLLLFAFERFRRFRFRAAC